MALVFTAISNSLCTLLLATRRQVGESGSLLDVLSAQRVILVALISIGLYSYGMALNDIIDRRRDRQLAAHRPIPSGRIPLATAHVICAALFLMALVAGFIYARRTPNGWISLVLLLWTVFLIAFYDFAGKYLVAVGLLTLGLIRFFHAIIPAPDPPLLWHPLLLFTHVSILSAVAYWWEEKRPELTAAHWFAVLGGVAIIDILAVSIVLARGAQTGLGKEAPDVHPGLLLPIGLALLFVVIAWRIRKRSPTSRQAGQTLMLTGLLWLIVYDSAFAMVYVGWRYALALLALLPLSYLMVQFMRWWSKLLSLSQPPDYKRVRSTAEVPTQP